MAKAKKRNLSPEELLEQALVPKDEQPYEVPGNWVWTYFSNVFRLQSGYAFKSDDYKNFGTPLIRISDICEGEVDISKCVFIQDNNVDKRFVIDKDDLLIAMSGATTGKNGIYQLATPAYLNQRVGNIKIINSNVVSSKFRNYYIHDRNQEILSKAYGGAQPNISSTVICKMHFPLPPLVEQQRIVNRIESLFAKLDKAKELAEYALDSFERRKAAILHKAFTGELTAKWREEHGVRMDSWEKYQLQDVCKVNPKRADISGLADDVKVTFVPMPAVSDVVGAIVDPTIKTLGEVKKGYTNFSEGDVLFAKITPCMENGKSAIVEKLLNDIGFGSTEFHVLRCSKKIYNKYLYHLVRHQSFRDEARAVMTGAVGQQRVPKNFLEEYPLNLPSLFEQQEIVRILDSLFEKEKQGKELLVGILEKIDLIKKAILARAFRGELGTNNPAEESAIELLKECLQ